MASATLPIVHGRTPAMQTVCNFCIRECTFREWLVFLCLQHFGSGDVDEHFPGRHTMSGTKRNLAHRMFNCGYSVGAASAELRRLSN